MNGFIKTFYILSTPKMEEMKVLGTCQPTSNNKNVNSLALSLFFFGGGVYVIISTYRVEYILAKIFIYFHLKLLSEFKPIEFK